MRDFRKYNVWQHSHEFVLELYKVIEGYPKSEQYIIVSQILRAAVSISTNISEGCGRNSDAEFARFIDYALGSLKEVEYLLQLSKDLNYITETNYNGLNDKLTLIRKEGINLTKKLKPNTFAIAQSSQPIADSNILT